MLKSLVLQGFKSFAEKISLEFPAGITAVVGPNGSGKSNVVDAVRWVLGEQSLKNIRLGKSEDVIFAGTPQRPSTGFAAVELVFDNSRRLFPDERSETAIGRRLYRDGTSVYLLNGQEARLKDIVRLMAAGKLGTRGLAIVTQGEGDAFLTSSPLDRRAMIEEAVGLKEYRLKKEEAERKMSETKTNLEKADSLITEIIPHLRSLKRQVSKWEKRQEKTEELKVLEEKYFHWKLRQIEDGSALTLDREALTRETEELRRDIENLENQRVEFESILARLRAKLRDERLSEIDRDRADTLRALGRAEGKIEALTNTPGIDVPAAKRMLEVLVKIKNELLVVLESGKDLEQARLIIEKVLKEIEGTISPSGDQTSEAENVLGKERGELIARMEALDQEATNLRRENEAVRLERENALGGLENALRALDQKRRLLGEKQEVVREYRLEIEKRHFQEEDLATRLRESGRDYVEFRNAYLNLPPPDIGETVSEIEVKISRLHRELADIGAVDEELVREHHATQERHDFLIAEKTDLERALQDLESLRKELDKKIDHEFHEALRKVSTQLGHYFRLLFGGGNARLREAKPRIRKLRTSGDDTAIISGEDEMAVQELYEPQSDEGGIEIEVDLPRKKIKSLDMLSGGERALTAIALVFAIAGSSSPPFLILDEIDAALDETNSQRFGRLLKELSGQTQFILITHNRVTMEAADALYGVTMQDGASKTFSLKFQDGETVAETIAP